MFSNLKSTGGIGEAARVAALGAEARLQGDESMAERCFRDAIRLALDVRETDSGPSSHAPQLEGLRIAAQCALECGETTQARQYVAKALDLEPSISSSEEWMRLIDLAKWTDPWLIAAIRRDPPDEEALDELASRYWKGLYGRCYLLTLHDQKAGDLAQEAWWRVLRRRTHLKPGGNFPAYLATVATNLWRDWYRAEERAGPLAQYRLESLDTSSLDEDEGLNLLDCVQDLKSLSANEQALLAIDIDEALKQLNPRLREVLLARFIAGESCAEIAHRCGRTEQSVSGWVRQALREMKLHLQSSRRGTATDEVDFIRA